jgi:60S ribosomal subunit assembly/export protein LOC1
MKARQMEEIREARRVEAEMKEEEKKSKLDDVKDSLRKKRKRKDTALSKAEESVKELTSTGSKAAKPKAKKKVTFA